ncbi:MAG TPA: hypothetical protein PLO37_02045 [Candidatus Hydrogenedentes bacterium]|nr:hypothetical protein [Candidatus Hydrogenedentota bacterium]HPG65599.1 hypothetical protein [Candidatus Hydrogenedentota bacterium]
MTVLAGILVVASMGAEPAIEFLDAPYSAHAGRESSVIGRVAVRAAVEAFQGTLVVSLSSGVTLENPRFPVSVPGAGRQVVEFSVDVPGGTQPWDYYITAGLDGTSAVAHAPLRVVQVDCPEGLAAGVIGDAEVWLAAFARLGVSATALASSDCTQERLKALALVVLVGDALGGTGDVLDRYVSGGGTVLIVAKGPGPWQDGLAVPGVEFGNEAADTSRGTLRAVAPPHPVASEPNAIGASEWQDWPLSEPWRSMTSWDAAFAPAVEYVDAQGHALGAAAVLVAAHEKGVYVLCSIPFGEGLSRIDPAALRLLANILAQ